jgi:hypothetical protein
LSVVGRALGDGAVLARRASRPARWTRETTMVQVRSGFGPSDEPGAAALAANWGAKPGAPDLSVNVPT